MIISAYLIVLLLTTQFKRRPCISPCSLPKAIIATASFDKTVKLWDFDEGSQCFITLKGHGSTVYQTAFNRDGSKIFTVSWDQTLKIWDVSTGICVKTLNGHSNSVSAVDISQEEKLIATGGADKSIIIWSAIDGSQLKSINALFQINRLLFSPNGNFIYATSMNLNEGVVEIFDIQTGLSAMKITPHSNDVYALTITNDGKYLITGSRDNTIKVLDINQNFKVIRTLTSHTDTITSLSASSDNSLLASSSADKSIIIWSLTNGKKLNTLTGHSLQVNSVKFFRSNKYLLSSSDDLSIKLWEIETGTCIKTHQSHTDYVVDVQIGYKCMRCQLAEEKVCPDCYCNCESENLFSVNKIGECTGGKLDECKVCPRLGVYIQDKGCYPCSNGCEKCQDLSTCNYCSPGFTLKDGHCCNINNCVVCSLETCSKCEDLYYRVYSLTPVSPECKLCNQPGEYIDEKNGACDGKGICLKHVECPISNCQKCANLYQECAACVKDFYIDAFLSNSACTTCVQSGRFIDGKYCYACPERCALCNKQNTCDKCQNGNYMKYLKTGFYQGLCSPCENAGEYKDENFLSPDGTGVCLSHSDCFIINCKQCSNLYKKCSLCLDGIFLDELSANTACISCLQNGRFVEGTRCLTCPEKCAKCQNQLKCEKCFLGFYLKYSGSGDLNNSTCSLCGKTAEYKDETFNSADGTGICLSHSECLILNCQKCSSLYKKCYNCLEGYYLDFLSENSRCISCLQPGRFIEGRFCMLCSDNCYSCKNNSFCEKCWQKYYLKIFINGKFSQTCSLCDREGEYKDEKNYLDDGTGYCLEIGECKISYCKKCSNQYKQCSLCDEGYLLNQTDSFSSCTLCNQDGYFKKDLSCESCHETCEICQSKNDCKKCKNGFFSSNGICLPCFKNCKICNSESFCQECQKGFFLKSTIEADAYDVCTSACYENFAKRKIDGADSLVCETCGLKQRSILLEPLFLVCKVCESLIKGCAICSNKYKCDECLPNYFYLNSSCFPKCDQTDMKILDTSEFSCTPECAAGFYQNYEEIYRQIICKQCPKECETCSSASDCTICKLGYFLQDNRCGKACIDKKFPNWAERKCSVCKNEEYPYVSESGINCVSCQAPCRSCSYNPTNCTSCISGLFWDQISCAKSCSQSQFGIAELGICGNCHKTCLSCSNGDFNGCKSCRVSTFFHQGSCLKFCPQKFFANETSQTCDPCHFTCSKCIGSDRSECTECLVSRVLSQTRLSNNKEFMVGECVCRPRFFELGQESCAECHFSCFSCVGRGFLDCTKCISNRGDDKKNPFSGRCACPTNTFDYLEDTCRDISELSTIVGLIFAQEQSVKYTTLTSVFGLGSLKLFGSIFNFVEIAQEINLYGFLNVGYPLNLESFLEFLSSFRFYKNFKFFQFEKMNIKSAMNQFSSQVRKNSTEGAKIFISKGISFSFLNNCLSTLILIFTVPLLVFILTTAIGYYFRHKALESEENLKGLSKILFTFWKNKRSILSKIISFLFLGSLQEIHLFAVLQFMQFRNDSFLDIINLLFSIFWIILEFTMITYASRAYLESNSYDFQNEKLCFPKLLKKFLCKTSASAFSIEQKKAKFPFLFDGLLKEDNRGMSYIFYKSFKKIILATIYTVFSGNVEHAINILIIKYILCYLFIRVTQPFISSISNIISELTEIGHVGFFLGLKYYVKAVNLKNSDLALSLGVYLIYAIILLISMNTAFMLINLILVFKEKTDSCKKSKNVNKKEKGESNVMCISHRHLTQGEPLEKMGNKMEKKNELALKKQDSEIILPVLKGDERKISDSNLFRENLQVHKDVFYSNEKGFDKLNLEMENRNTNQNQCNHINRNEVNFEPTGKSLKKLSESETYENKSNEQESNENRYHDRSLNENPMYEELQQEFRKIHDKYKETHQKKKKHRKYL